MAAGIGRDDEAEPWPPSREALAAAFAGGQTLAVIGRRHGRSPASVSLLAARYGLATARAAGRLARPPAAPGRSWPPSDGIIAELAAAGVGDGRAAALFGVHPSTYRAWRRRLRDRSAAGGADEAPRGDGPSCGDGPSYGYDPMARWPAGMRFEDDARAARADRTGRVARPLTVVEGASSLATLAG